MASDSKNSQVASRPSGSQHFYRKRQRIYTGLLLFVVIVGLPIVGLPPLRQRLSSRVQVLKTALAGGIRPVTVKAGEGNEPFPSEYEKPAPPLPLPPQLPPLERIFTATSSSPSQSAPRIQSPPKAAKVEESPLESVPEKPAERAPPAADDEPRYQQGKIEQDAYDLLLQSDPAAAAMVQGKNPSLSFRSWDAAKKEEDTYWVRLTFLSSPGDSNVEYVWQVKLLLKKVTPLSYNARAISQP